MQSIILYFQHGIEDVIPWSEFIEELRPQLAHIGVGEFASDDMAIDGGDCAAIFEGADAEKLFAVLLPHFRSLPFLRKPTTRVELIFGETDSASERKIVGLEC